jgi:hypothetical protein
MSKKQYRVWLTLICHSELQVAGDIESELTEDELIKELESVHPKLVKQKLSDYVEYNQIEKDRAKTVIIIKKE